MKKGPVDYAALYEHRPELSKEADEVRKELKRLSDEAKPLFARQRELNEQLLLMQRAVEVRDGVLILGVPAPVNAVNARIFCNAHKDKKEEERRAVVIVTDHLTTVDLIYCPAKSKRLRGAAFLQFTGVAEEVCMEIAKDWVASRILPADFPQIS